MFLTCIQRQSNTLCSGIQRIKINPKEKKIIYFKLLIQLLLFFHKSVLIHCWHLLEKSQRDCYHCRGRNDFLLQNCTSSAFTFIRGFLALIFYPEERPHMTGWSSSERSDIWSRISGWSKALDLASWNRNSL